jgi:hypothetical protein
MSRYRVHDAYCRESGYKTPRPVPSSPAAPRRGGMVSLGAYL